MQDWMEFIEWDDRISVYRGGGKDANGNPAGRPQPVTGAQNQPCKNFATENYDQVDGPVRLKQDNFQSADYVQAEMALDIRADDIAKVVVAKTGRTEWYRVRGAPQIRPDLEYLKVFVVTIPEPRL